MSSEDSDHSHNDADDVQLNDSEDASKKRTSKGYTSTKIKFPSIGKKWISDPKPRVFDRNLDPHLIELTTEYRWSKYEKNLVEKEMLNTIVKHTHPAGINVKSYNIIKIEKVVNGYLWRQYEKRRDMFKKEGIKFNERLLWHGTDQTAILIKSGFDIRYSDPSGMYGAGIYFAKHSSKSNQYTFGYMGSNLCRHEKKACDDCERKLLLCRVLMGRAKYVEDSVKYPHPPEDYNSVVAKPPAKHRTGTVLYPEYIVFSEDQVYPQYLVTYKTVTSTN